MTDQRVAVAEPTLGFGHRFTEHMAVARFRGAAGWSEVEVVPFEDLVLSPAAMVLHYGQAIFEGLKAFRQADGSVALFRPADNADRFDRSARRLAMPPLPPRAFVDACRSLVDADVEHVPSAMGQSLYLRPFMIATEAALGVRPAHEYLFAVIASPVGAYFASGSDRIRVLAVRDDVRAAPGGTGAAKCAGNYAASLRAKAAASTAGCDEVLWLDAGERRWVEELGGMNAVFVVDDGDEPVVVSPPPTDTILDGVTRRSLLDLASDLGHRIEVRPISLEEITRPGRLLEAFACGTAATVAPVGAVVVDGAEHPIGDGRPGPLTTQLRDLLLGIQRGDRPDPRGWMVAV